MSSHTPGPWSAFVHRRTKTLAVSIGDKANGQRPCIVDWTGFDNCDLPLAQQIANARLIAAAPELLEALRRANDFITNGIALGFIRMPDTDTPDPAQKTPAIVRAAIAKATGEQA